MSEKKQIIKDTFQLTSARYLSQGIGFITSIAMRRFLGPFYIGVWSLFRVALDYSSYLLLGISEGVSYKIPFLTGQNNTVEEERVKNNAFNFIFLVSLLTSAALLITALFFRKSYPPEVITGLTVLAFYVILDRACGYYMLLLRTKMNFTVLSKSIIFDAVVNLCLILLLVKNYKIYGLYLSVILLSVLNTLYIHSQAKYRIRLTFKFQGIWELIKTGSPIAVLGFMDWVLISIDRIMIAKMIGITFVGYYSISIMTKGYISQLSGFGTVLYPRLLERYGKSQKIQDIQKFVITPVLINAYLMPLVLGVIYFLIPVLVKAILPKFIPGILATQILLVDMFFRSCYPQSTHFLIALKKQTRSIPIIAAAIALNIAGNYLFIKMGYGICGAALATSLVSFLTFLAMQFYAMKHFAGLPEILLFFREVLIPFFYILAGVLLLEKFINIQNPIVCAGLKITILCAIYLPLFLYINRKTQILSHILNLLLKRQNEK